MLPLLLWRAVYLAPALMRISMEHWTRINQYRYKPGIFCRRWFPSTVEKWGWYPKIIKKWQDSRKTALNTHFSRFLRFRHRKHRISPWVWDKILKHLRSHFWLHLYQQNFPKSGKPPKKFLWHFQLREREKMTIFLQKTPFLKAGPSSIALLQTLMNLHYILRYTEFYQFYRKTYRIVFQINLS